LHRNDEQNRGYAAFLSGVIDRAFWYAGKPRNALDWGSGPNPLAAELLARRGVETAVWDPLFGSAQIPPKESFDLVLCIETAEHFAEPRRDFRELARTLRPGAWAFIHTHLAPEDDAEFLKWWYIQDITHISFYSEKSLRILGDVVSLSFARVEENKLIAFRRPLSALVAGGINLDIEGRPYCKPIVRDSNPGSVHFSPGGCARNMAENLSRLGMGTELVGAVGDDVFGEGLLESARTAGIGVAGVAASKGNITSTYVSLLDERGDMSAAVSGMDICDEFTRYAAEPALDRAVDSARRKSFCAGGTPFSALLLDGNLLPETGMYIRGRFSGLPCWFDPVSAAKTRRTAEYRSGIFFDGLAGIKLNTLEARALVGCGESAGFEELLRLLKERLKGLIYVTLGADGAVRLDESGIARYKCPEIEPVSATGAGDAFLAGVVRRRMLGVADCADDLIAGSAGAYLALQSPQSVPPDLSAESLESLILRWHFLVKVIF
jgi:pseudouridine kinase